MCIHFLCIHAWCMKEKDGTKLRLSHHFSVHCIVGKTICSNELFFLREVTFSQLDCQIVRNLIRGIVFLVSCRRMFRLRCFIFAVSFYFCHRDGFCFCLTMCRLFRAQVLPGEVDWQMHQHVHFDEVQLWQCYYTITTTAQ